MVISGTDRKIRNSITRDNNIKEYGVNLKLGCFRLGKRFMFVSNQQSQTKVAYFYKEDTNPSNAHYKMSYYCYSSQFRDLSNLSYPIGIDKKY